MGVDFLEKSKPTFTKAWDRGRVDLCAEDLFTRLPTVASRTFNVNLVSGASVTNGDRITVEKVGSLIVVSQGLNEVARCEVPPKAIASTLEAHSGIASGLVVEVHALGGIAEILVE